MSDRWLRTGLRHIARWHPTCHIYDRLECSDSKTWREAPFECLGELLEWLELPKNLDPQSFAHVSSSTNKKYEDEYCKKAPRKYGTTTESLQGRKCTPTHNEQAQSWLRHTLWQ